MTNEKKLSKGGLPFALFQNKLLETDFRNLKTTEMERKNLINLVNLQLSVQEMSQVRGGDGDGSAVVPPKTGEGGEIIL